MTINRAAFYNIMMLGQLVPVAVILPAFLLWSTAKLDEVSIIDVKIAQALRLKAIHCVVVYFEGQ